MSELTKSFKPLDPEAYAAAFDGVIQLIRRFSTGRVLHDTAGNRIESLEEWLPAVYAGTWPRPMPDAEVEGTGEVLSLNGKLYQLPEEASREPA